MGLASANIVQIVVQIHEIVGEVGIFVVSLGVVSASALHLVAGGSGVVVDVVVARVLVLVVLLELLLSAWIGVTA